MGDSESPKIFNSVVLAQPPSDVGTENGRFNSVPMCQSLTGECARRFGKALKIFGGDNVEDDLASGRVEGSGGLFAISQKKK